MVKYVVFSKPFILVKQIDLVYISHTIRNQVNSLGEKMNVPISVLLLSLAEEFNVGQSL